MRIIAVDDEPFALDDFQYTCSKISGITDIRTFENPADALRYAQIETVDVAFLDIEMPVLTLQRNSIRLTRISKLYL